MRVLSVLLRAHLHAASAASERDGRPLLLSHLLLPRVGRRDHHRPDDGLPARRHVDAVAIRATARAAARSVPDDDDGDDRGAQTGWSSGHCGRGVVQSGGEHVETSRDDNRRKCGLWAIIVTNPAPPPHSILTFSCSQNEKNWLLQILNFVFVIRLENHSPAVDFLTISSDKITQLLSTTKVSHAVHGFTMNPIVIWSQRIRRSLMRRTIRDSSFPYFFISVSAFGIIRMTFAPFSLPSQQSSRILCFEYACCDIYLLHLSLILTTLDWQDVSQ